MPGTCSKSFSNEANKKWYQKLANAMQINHRADYDKVIGDGWYASGEYKFLLLQKGGGSKAMAEFEKLATDFAGIPKNVKTGTELDIRNQQMLHGVQLGKYLQYYSRSDSFWKNVDKFKKLKIVDKKGFREAMRTIKLDPMAREFEDALLVREAVLDGVQIGTFDTLLKDMKPQDIAIVNSFIENLKKHDMYDSFNYFLRQTDKKTYFIEKATSHTNYIGALDDVYKKGLHKQIRQNFVSSMIDYKGDPADLMFHPNRYYEEYTYSKLAESFPELAGNPEKMQEMMELFTLKKGDNKLKQGAFLNFLDGVFQNGVVKGALSNSRVLSNMTKFFFLTPGAMILTAINLFTNTFQWYGLKMGMPEYHYSHPLVDYFVKSDVLKGIVNYEQIRSLLTNQMNEYTDEVVMKYTKTLPEGLYERFVDKPLYWMASWLPKDSKLKYGVDKAIEVTHAAILTGGHNIQDHMAAPLHLRNGIARAALEVFGDDFDGTLKLMKAGLLKKEDMARFIVRAKELAEAGNNSFSSGVLRKHILATGPFAAVSYLQGYHVQRIGELTAAFKKLADAFANGEISSMADFRVHLWTRNAELHKVLGITLAAAHMGFFIDHYSDDENNNNEYDYGAQFHEYVSCFNAFVGGKIFSNILSSHGALNVYKDVTGNDVPLLADINYRVVKFLDQMPSLLLRELDVWKIIPRMMKALGSDDMETFLALGDEALEQMFNGITRYGMPEGVNTFSQVTVPESDDAWGSVLMNMRTTNRGIRLSDQIYTVSDVEKFVNGDKDKMLEEVGSWFKALPMADILFSETTESERWHVIENIKQTDPIFKAYYNRDDNLFGQFIDQYATDGKREKEIVDEFYNDLTAFNYYQWKKDGTQNNKRTDFYTKDKYDMEKKEELFTTLLEEKIGAGYIDQLNEFVAKQQLGEQKLHYDMYNTKNKSAEEAGLQKLVAMAEAKTPGAGRVALSYVVAQRFYRWAQENGPKGDNGYLDTKQLGDFEPAMKEKKSLLKEFFPYLAVLDKPSYIKVLSTRLKDEYPKTFGDISTSQKQMINSLMLLDTVVHEQAVSGEPNAGLINNVMTMSSKYFQNDETRIKVLKYLIENINALDIDTDRKNLLISGVLVGSPDMLAKIRGNKAIMEKNADTVNYVTNHLFGAVDDVRINGKNVYALMEEEMQSTKKQGYYSQYTGNKYVPRPYQKTNSAVYDKLASADANIPRTGYLPKSYDYDTNFQRGQANYIPTTPLERFAIVRPKLTDDYYRAFQTAQLSALTSKDLILQTVKRSPLGENNEYTKPRENSYVKRVFPNKPSIKPLKTGAVKKKSAHTELPGGLPNIG